MAKTGYSEDELFQIGRNCYDKLVLHCQTLEISGFWAQAERVMQQKSSEVLDLYVQTVLMKLVMEFDEVLESQLRFIATLTCSNPLGITRDLEMDETFVNDVEKVYKMPPVLIQLCSLYDKEKEDDVTQYFVDALLNILLCMAYLNVSVNSDKVNDFIENYYDKISYYISEKTASEHTYYLSRKLGSSEIACDIDLIRKEDEQAKIEKIAREKAERQAKETPAPKYAPDVE